MTRQQTKEQTMTITRVLPVIARTTRTLEVGDVVAEGWGTLNVVAREVVAVERWMHNGYVNAIVTWADGERRTYYDGTRWSPVEVAPRRINAYLARPGQVIRRNGVTVVVRHVRPTDDPHTFRVWCCCGSFSVNTADLVDLVRDAA